MLNAIGSSSFAYYAASAPPSTAALEAQLKQYQNKLADCVSCSSSKTPEGKKNIQELSNKISVLEAQIEKLAKQQPKKIDAVLPVNTQNSVAETHSSVAENLGQRLDIFV